MIIRRSRLCSNVRFSYWNISWRGGVTGNMTVFGFRKHQMPYAKIFFDDNLVDKFLWFLEIWWICSGFCSFSKKVSLKFASTPHRRFWAVPSTWDQICARNFPKNFKQVYFVTSQALAVILDQVLAQSFCPMVTNSLQQIFWCSKL